MIDIYGISIGSCFSYIFDVVAVCFRNTIVTNITTFFTFLVHNYCSAETCLVQIYIDLIVKLRQRRSFQGPQEVLKSIFGRWGGGLHPLAPKQGRCLLTHLGELWPPAFPDWLSLLILIPDVTDTTLHYISPRP